MIKKGGRVGQNLRSNFRSMPVVGTSRENTEAFDKTFSVGGGAIPEGTPDESRGHSSIHTVRVECGRLLRSSALVVFWS